MRTAKVSISVPHSMKQFVDMRVLAGEYGSVSEYFRDLIRADHETATGRANAAAAGPQRRHARPPLASAARHEPEPRRYSPEEMRQIMAARERERSR
ncbi:MAG: hypothetical protein KA746_08745 [Pyrinomonadaceae bacterium]|nr:hypothetical protein [Pyrinomonadaceae bacterium]MBP6212462.1 hypothetical protein [Pyrinomonadaceae bacterium]